MAQRSGAPVITNLGISDVSGGVLPHSVVATPAHMPLIPIFAAKGLPARQYFTAAELDAHYGKISFDERSAFATINTPLLNMLRGKGNVCCTKRIVPDDAPPPSNIRFWLDILATDVPLYTRNTDGSFVTDVNGALVSAGVTPGIKYKWVTTFADPANPVLNDEFGLGQIVVGDQTDPITNTQSVRYPIFDHGCAWQGLLGDNVGVKYWAPTGNMPNASMLTNERVYPFCFSMISRATKTSSASPVQTILGAQYRIFALKPNVVDAQANAAMYIDDVLIDAYSNLKDLRFEKRYADIDKLHTYQLNIETVLALIHAKESTHIDSFSDLGLSPDDRYLINIFSGQNSNGTEYFTFQKAAGSVNMSQNTNHWLRGGGDGTLSKANFEAGTIAMFAEYANPESELQSAILHPESFFHDMGYSMPVKYAATDLLAVRPDIHLFLATHVDGETVADPATTTSRAQALVARIRLYPDSNYFATSNSRGSVIPGNLLLAGSNWKRRISAVYSIAEIFSSMLGASSGMWNMAKDFTADGDMRTITGIKDADIPYLSSNNIITNWVNGWCAPEPSSPTTFMWPMIRTVYPDDTSVMVSPLVSLAATMLMRFIAVAHMKFKGTEGRTDQELITAVTNYLNTLISGVFGGKYTIDFSVFITPEDQAAGFGFTVVGNIAANQYKTAMTMWIVSRRVSQLANTGA